MDLTRLNGLVEKVAVLYKYLEFIGRDPKIEECLADCIAEIDLNYSGFLTNKLFDFYEDYFEDDEMRKLTSYLISEVPVHGDELEQGELLLSIKPSPLRIEVSDPRHLYKSVLWQAA